MTTSARDVFAVMTAVANADEPLRARDISAALDLQISATHRALNTLVGAGYLSRHHAGASYVAGHQIARLRHAFLSRFGIREAALPHMQLLAFITGETVALRIPLGWYAVLISSVSGTKDVIDIHPLGQVTPLGSRPGGLIILASLGEERLSRFIEFSARRREAPTDPELRRRLTEIAARGYAFADTEDRVEHAAVAFPVRCEGAVVASLTIEGPAISRCPDSSDLLSRCRDVVGEFETRLNRDPSRYRDPYRHLPPDSIDLYART